MVVRVEMDWIEAMSVFINKKIIWIEMNQMGKPGDNYASVLTRSTIAYKCDREEEEKRMNIVLKEPLLSNNPCANTALNGYRIAEIMMYSEVLKIYNDLLHESKLREKFWPECYFINSSKIILLEDLKESGIEQPRDLSVLSEEHAILALQALGRFHALSVAGIQKGLLNPERDNRFKFFFTEEGLGDSFVLTGMQSVIDAILTTWPSEWKPLSKKLSEIRGSIMLKLRMLEKEQPRVMVINHGDIWTRNIMFKYNKDKPTNIRFLDFQNPHYNSWGFDLCHLFTACFPLDLRIRKRTMLFNIYLRSFKEILTSLGCDLSLAPTMDETVKEMERLELFSLVVSCTVVPLQNYEGESPVAFEDYMDLDPERDSVNTKKQIYTNPVLTQLLKNVFKFYESINLFK